VTDRGSDLPWTKSWASASDNCVEVALTTDRVLVRDSKDRPGPVLSFTRPEWEAFLIGVRRDQPGLV
jgi:hypothetical protein